MLAEQQTEWIISNNLVNKGWYIDTILKRMFISKNQNQKQNRQKLNGKKTGLYLYESNNDKTYCNNRSKKQRI